MSIYICEIVSKVQAALVEAPIAKFDTTVELIDAHAQILLCQFESKTAVAKCHISNWHPELVGKSAEEIFAAPFSIDESRLTLSREFGFVDWADAEKRSETIDQEFERCVDLVLNGDSDAVRKMVTENPELAKQTSLFGHRATLLLYLGANGVETWRQYVPLNSPAMASLLIELGADPNAKMNVYGGQFDCIAMADSSCHPREAGLTEELVKVLKAAL